MYSLGLFVAAIASWYIGSQQAKNQQKDNPKDVGEVQWMAITKNPFRAIAVFLWVGSIIAMYNRH